MKWVLRFLCVLILVGSSLGVERVQLIPAITPQRPQTGSNLAKYLDRLEVTSTSVMLSNTFPRVKQYQRSVALGYRDSDGEVNALIKDREYMRHFNEARLRQGEFLIVTDNQDLSSWSGRDQLGWWRINKWFRDNISPLGWIYADGFHLGAVQLDLGTDYGFVATFQPVYGIESINTDDERGAIARISSGFRVEGAYKTRKDDHFYYMVDFRDNAEYGNGPYTSRTQLYEDRWPAVELKGKSSTSYDVSESFLQYWGKDLAIMAGRGRHQWGPAEYGSLFLNGYGPPFDYVRFDGLFESTNDDRAIYYTFLHGWLESQVQHDTLYYAAGGRARVLNAQKYLSAQRVEIRPAASAIFGFNQGVIYGDRGLQLGYLTPLNWLYSVQHSNDDKDNLLLGGDFKWRPVRGLKLYGELLFDDVVFGDLFKSTANNKSAYTVGAHAIYPRPFWEKFDGRVEYTKIRPFVYSHFFETNRYSHWTSPLGYTREPNSEFMTAEVRGTFYPVQVSLIWSRQNHGANYYYLDRGGIARLVNVGGDINSPQPEDHDADYPFLDGKFERTTRTGISINWEALPGLNLFASAMQIEETGADKRLETRMGFGWNL